MREKKLSPEEKAFVRKCTANMLNGARAVLEPKETHLLALMFGLVDEHEYTYEEISELPDYPDTVEEVRGVVEIAMHKMIRAIRYKDPSDEDTDN